MQQSIRIKTVGVYHPNRSVRNEEIITHFKEQGQEIEALLKALGRENRYISENNETTLTMAVESTKDALQKAGLQGRDLDMIVFSSGTPEYLFPPTSLIIHNEINGKEKATVYDTNTACVGMVVSVEQVSRVMLTNPNIKYALVVGSEHMFHYSNKDNPFTYANFGDASCAVILEKIDEENQGFIGSSYFTNSEFRDKVMFPACGLSKVFQEDIKLEDKLFKWENISPQAGYGMTATEISNLLKQYDYSPDDVKFYFTSQLSKRAMSRTLEELGETDDHKLYFVGEEYGYTGTSSPFLALERAVRNEELKRGDVIVFWSLGSGITTCTMLFRY